MASNGKNKLPGKTGRESVYIDWKDTIFKDFVPDDQKNTATCWAFAISLCVSVLALMEHEMPNDGLWRLSVQELVDRVCHNYRPKVQPPKVGEPCVFKQDALCNYGSLSRYGFLYCMDFGLSYDHHYPFAGKRNLGKSMPAEKELPRVYISGYKMKMGSASKHMDTILKRLKKHPLVGKLYATNEFRESHEKYMGRDSGIEHITETVHGVVATEAHSVLIVGYIGESDCFLILNSWGKSFGNEGFLLVASKLMFDVGWPKKSYRADRRDKDQNTKLPRKPQFSEHVITSAGSNPPEERHKREIFLKANGLRMSKTVAIAENLKVFRNKTLLKANVTRGGEEAVVNFEGIAMLTSRERYNVEAPASFLSLQGQANDFKIQCSSIVSLGSLLKGLIYEELTMIIRSLSGAEVTRPGKFRSCQDGYAVKLSHVLYPLEKNFFFLPIVHIETSSTNGPPTTCFVRADMLPSGSLIRPCDAGGAIINIVDHIDLDTWSVREVPRPLHKSFRILLQSLQHIRQIALETSGEIQFTGGRQPSFLRALSQRLCRDFNDAVNGFVDDGCSILGSDGVENVNIVINSNAKKYIGSQYNSTLLMLPTFGAMDCAKASLLLQDVPLALLLRFPGEHQTEWADYGVDAYFAAFLKASLCTIPYARPGGFSGTKVVQLEGHALYPEDMAISRDMYLLQDMPSVNRTLDLASTLEVGSDGARPHGLIST